MKVMKGYDRVSLLLSNRYVVSPRTGLPVFKKHKSQSLSVGFSGSGSRSVGVQTFVLGTGLGLQAPLKDKARAGPGVSASAEMCRRRFSRSFAASGMDVA